MKKLIAVFLFSIWFSLLSLSLCFGQTGNQFILQVQNSGTAVYTASSFAVLNLTSGCSGTVSSGVLSVTCTGSGGSTAFPVTVTGGVSGAVPYFSNTTTESAGALLATNALVFGGGSGAAPATGNGDFTYATHTLTMGASGLLNLSAGATGAFVLPVVAGCTASANGVVCYDTTAGNTHQRTNAADSLSVGEASALAANTIPKATDATHSLLTASSLSDNGTTVSTAEGISALSYTGTGATAGFVQLGQGSTNSTGTTAISQQAPTAVTSYLETLPGTAAQGVKAGTLSGTTITENFTGSSAFTPTVITIGSGTSIGATSLCSTTNCPAGNYQVNVYVEVTTACTTTGSYAVWLGYTDDAGAKNGSATTTSFPLTGNGTTPITSAAGASLVPTSTADYATGQFFLHTTGAANNSLGSINYGTTAGACGTGGPMVGKMFLTVVPLS